MPVAVFGAALHNNARHLPESLESLLSQTERDLAVVLLDDASIDATPEVARSYAGDARVAYERNPVRRGLVGTWRRVLELARRRHPDAAYLPGRPTTTCGTPAGWSGWSPSWTPIRRRCWPIRSD